MNAEAHIDAHYDALVVGAGPAGMSAASRLAAQGLRVAVIDEQTAPGGQIYRAVGASPLPSRRILGADYWHGETLLERFVASGAEYLAQTTVWQIDRVGEHWRVAVSAAGESRLMSAAYVVLATGAHERPVPVPGWTLPGVMTVGAAQVLLKTTGAVPERATVLAGCGPLLWLYAAQVLRAGGRIDALLDTTPRAQRRAAIKHLFRFLNSDYLLKGVSLLLEVKRSVNVIGNVASFRATGVEHVDAVEYTLDDGARGRLAVDTLLVHQGVVPNVNLSNALGCEHEWNDAQCCWQPKLDEWLHSSRPRVFVAGDGSGIGGARAAEAQGELVALQIAHLAGVSDTASRDAAAARVRARIARALRGRAFFETLYRPADAMRIPRGDTLVCRCEEVTAQQVVDAARIGCSGPNQLKAFLRCGMGPCQGRLCGLTVCELLSRETGVPPRELGYYTLRFPTKPLTLAEIAALPATQEGDASIVTA
ncbi:FAD-dependent oxidoreductase [Burkholderia multivorans]|uniref:FAD-dependent oxidoreductase n=1 Tax=Burkholderia multivorans TaxID=87883 RepID=UPI0009C0E21B|nr:FAD-dependent oxidoreductase [Burkholderia multivorans]MDN8104215.1 FAD-dependent oxidoreductase [Burkholderia multivorans]